MFNDTLLNFCKRYEDKLMVIFDPRSKLHLGLDALNNQKILKGIYDILKNVKKKGWESFFKWTEKITKGLW